MTSELEQEFFRVFGICKKCSDKRYEKCMGICCDCKYFKHSEITDHKLLEMICIWNYIMPCIDDCILPVDYLGLKSVVLDKIIRYSEIEYEFDVDALKYQIQQLFKEEEWTL